MNTSPETQQVQMLAYQLWEAEGRPAGREMAHWIEAERRLALEFRPGGPPEQAREELSKAAPVDVVATPRAAATPIASAANPATGKSRARSR